MNTSLSERISARRDNNWTTVEGENSRLHVCLQGGRSTFAQSVWQSLNETPRWLDCRWLYDDIGSGLYERITEQPEYYLTRLEEGILRDNAARIRELVGAATIVELGSGSSTKTRRLIDAWLAEGDACYVPIDISHAAVEHAVSTLATEYPRLQVEGLAAGYGRGLTLIEGLSPVVLLLLGSTIGNFNDSEFDEFMTMVAAALRPGDRFVLGLDLIKDKAMIDAAYNDAAGWTEQFMLNLPTRMNRQLGTGLALDRISYEGSYSEERERVEMFLRFDEAAAVRLPRAPRPIKIAAGESVMTEISRKFDPDRVVAKLGGFGFALQQVFTDPEDFYAVLLLEREK